MESKQEPKFPLRLLVDKERNRVVLAEAGADLIDILFSFLTLPLGTAIRLVSKKQQNDQSAEVGCINNLYQSVENFGPEVFWNHTCKAMLLSPRNPCEDLCQKLKLKVDDSDPTQYFVCRSCRSKGNLWLSTFSGANCGSCGKLMDKEMKLHEDSDDEETNGHGGGVFVKEETTYLIFDDLKVVQSSPGNSVQQLLQLGYKNFHKLVELSPSVGLNEVQCLLKQALTSKSPLSDVFLANGKSKQTSTFSPKPGTRSQLCVNNCIINLKVTVMKSKQKILYAEAEEDFVDFLFSFLTTPLGSFPKLLDGNCSLGCMDYLYKSVKDLNPSWFTMSSDTPLLDLRVAYQFGCKMQPLKLSEDDTPNYWYSSNVFKNNSRCFMNNGVISKNTNLILNPKAMKLFDPRSGDGTIEFAEGFVKRPSLFVVLVWDDLQVTSLADTSSISILQELNVPLDDLEQQVLSIGETEALNLLRASLTSKTALTDGLSYLLILKKPKEEA